MWKRIVKAMAINNGRCLHQQQLTKDDIPVVVQKCINFVCCYGKFFLLLCYKSVVKLAEVSNLINCVCYIR